MGWMARGLELRWSCLAGHLLFLLFLLAVQPGCAGAPAAPAPAPAPVSDAEFIEQLERRTFQFFWDTADPVTGLVPDRYPTPSFASIAAVGFGLAAYPIGAERGYITRAQAAERVLRTLTYLEQLPQGPDPVAASGYHGFFYHFLDMKSGLRFAQVELSTMDTALLMAGAFTCQAYFTGGDPRETAIRQATDRLNARIDWPWAMARANRICMGWSPEGGFINWDWKGYMESMVLLVVALGSPTHPVPAEVWPTYTASQVWGNYQGQDYVCFGPLFGHQFSHLWIDFRGLKDDYMRARGIDYAENTRRATYAQRAYAVANPGRWQGYGANMWGFSACDGPADLDLDVAGRARHFQTYAARGVGIQGVLDDGTLTPNAAAGSLPFAPEIALPALREMARRFGPDLYSTYGFFDSCNETFPAGAKLYHGRMVPGKGWVDTDYLGLDQGLVLTAVENHRSGMVWNLLRGNPVIVRGLRRAGFTGGWLDQAAAAGRRKE